MRVSRAWWLVWSLGVWSGCGTTTGDGDTDLPSDDTTNDDSEDGPDTDVAIADADGDGFSTDQGDCDDDDGTVAPDAIEVWYDGVDQDCAGDSDFDADQDGQDSDAHGGTDCDDALAAVYLGAPDAPYDGLDADCAGDSDFDADHDGQDSDAHGGTDCDDTRADVSPDALEVWYDGVDADCAGDSDFDADHDGHDSDAHGGTDCDDALASVFVGAEDAPYDGLDADCGGDSDFDADHDGYDSDAHGGDDCDDTTDFVSPDARERCNGTDDDCDSLIDEPGAQGSGRWYTDADADGHGAGEVIRTCTQPTGTVALDDDCDDDAEDVYPGASTVACDGMDNDCDGTTEEQGGGARLGADVYPTVTDAIAAAAPGDTVQVCEGRHFVQGLEPGGALTVEAAFPGGGLPVTLDAQDADGIFEIRTVSPILLRGLTLTGGRGTLTGGDIQGGAIWGDSGTNLVLEDCVVEGNRAGEGGGIWLGRDSTLTLRNTVVRDNVGDSNLGLVPHGGNVVVGGNGRLTLEDATVAGGVADACAGVMLGEDATLIGLGVSVIRGNDASLRGGGVCATDSGVLLSGVTIELNTAAAGAGIDAVNVRLVDVVVRNNDASLLGGGLTLSGYCSVSGGEVTGNVAGVGVGGVDLAFPASTLLLIGTRVAANRSTFFAASAGGVEIHGGLLTSDATDWGTTTDNSPADVALATDGRSYNWSGVRTFSCDDGSGLGCL